MVREPSLETVAELLRNTVRDLGAQLGHQASLNLAAQTKGYKNFAHFRKQVRPEPKVQVVSAPSEDYPQKVNWLALTDADYITHIEVNGNLRTLEYKAKHQLISLEFGDRHAERTSSPEAVALEYHVSGSPSLVTLTVGELIGASEVAPGLVELKDGKRIRFLAESEDGFEVLWLSKECCVLDK